MENVYNRSSRIIKEPTVHRINVCESRSCPCTDAETWQAHGMEYPALFGQAG